MQRYSFKSIYEHNLGHTLQGCPNKREDLPHALVLCQGNYSVGIKVMDCLRNYCPHLTVELEVGEKMELPLVSCVTTGYSGNAEQAKPDQIPI